MDDIYLYGGMKFDSPPTWTIPHSKITLEEKIGSGSLQTFTKPDMTQSRMIRLPLLQKCFKVCYDISNFSFVYI